MYKVEEYKDFRDFNFRFCLLQIKYIKHIEWALLRRLSHASGVGLGTQQY